MFVHQQHYHLPIQVARSADPYADWQPERAFYAECGHFLLDRIAALEAHVGGTLNVTRLRMLASMRDYPMPEGGYCFEAAAIRKLKSNPGRGCPPHVRDRLWLQLQMIWPANLEREREHAAELKRGVA